MMDYWILEKVFAIIQQSVSLLISYELGTYRANQNSF